MLPFIISINGCGGGGCNGGGPPNSGAVTGIVVDTNYNPLNGVNVQISGVSAVSGTNGRYNSSNVPIGLQTISFSANDYIAVSRQITVSALETTYVPMTVIPKKDSKSTEIGTGGGQVETTDGTIVITIPADSLKENTTITVSSCEITSAPQMPPQNYKFISLAYVSPPDSVLNSNLTISFVLPTQYANESSVSFFWLDPNTYSWSLIGKSAPSSGIASISIGKLGWIAAAVSLSSNYGSISGRVISSLGPIIVGANVWSSSIIAITDTNGMYTLQNIPKGTVKVYASGQGFNSNSIDVSVSSGDNSGTDIVLTPTSSLYGSIIGSVKDAANLSKISQARVIGGGKETTTDVNGDFVLSDISPGDISVSVLASGYKKKISQIAVASGKIATLDFLIDQTAVLSFNDDFEANKGWTISSTYINSPRSLWHRVNNSSAIVNKLAPDYVTLPDFELNKGANPSSHSGGYSYWFGDDDKGCYIGTQRINPPDTALSGGFSDSRYQGDLTSPKINLSGFAKAVMSFWTWWEIESEHPSTGFDIMTVKVSNDGGTNWNDFGRLSPSVDPAGKAVNLCYSSGGFNKPGIWIKHEFDLTRFAGDEIYIRFSFDTKDNKYNGFRGWFIDDVEVKPR